MRASKEIYHTIDGHHRKEALLMLKNRLARGESAQEILKIDDTYYAEKICSGLMPISPTLYKNITRKNYYASVA
ncbi:MAG: hypothetical protein FWD49_01855 [Firmicutes bacterium]|nr:hypothetical protein [Bacillota bacterium]